MQASERAATPTPSATGTRSALARVRVETQELHEQIEGAVPLLRAGAAAGTCRWYLQKPLGYHRPLERVLFSTPGLAVLGLRRHEREKGPWLERDLQALGSSREQLGQLPDCSVLPELTSVPSALGCAYVLEGATLGAQLLRRELGQRWPELMACASGYLRCYGAHTGARWSAFTSALERLHLRAGARGPGRSRAARSRQRRARDVCQPAWLAHAGATGAP